MIRKQWLLSILIFSGIAILAFASMSIPVFAQEVTATPASEITATVESSPTPLPDAAPLIASVTVNGTLHGDVFIPEREQKIIIPVSALDQQRREQIFADHTIVGSLSGEGKNAIVRITGQQSDSSHAGVVFVEVQVEGLNSPGTYTGKVDVVDNGSSDDSVELSVVILGAKPLITTLDVNATLFNGEVIPDLPIIIPVDTPNEASHTQIIQADSQNPQEDVVLGVVSGMGGSGTVILSCCCDEHASAATMITYVCLEVRGLELPGVYEGKVDVTDNHSAEDAVTLKMTIADSKAFVATISTTRILRHPWRIETLELIPVSFGPQEGGNAPRFFPVDTLVGQVSGTEQLGNVVLVECQPVSDFQRCLEVQGISLPAVYSGTVDLTDNQDSTDAITLGVTVTHAVIWPVLAILGGIFLSLLFAYLVQTADLRAAIEERKCKLRDEINKENAKEEGKKKKHQLTLDPAYFEGFETYLNNYKKTRLFWDKNSEDFKFLIKMLDSAEGDLGLLASQVDASMQEFNDKFSLFEALVKTAPLSLDLIPLGLIQKIKDLREGGKIEIGKLHGRLDAWKKYTAFMEQWMDWVSQILRQRRWCEELKKKPELSKLDRIILDRVSTDLNEAAFELYDIAVPEDASSFKILEELEKCYEKLSGLGGKYNTWLPKYSANREVAFAQVKILVDLEDLKNKLGDKEISEIKRLLSAGDWASMSQVFALDTAFLDQMKSVAGPAALTRLSSAVQSMLESALAEYKPKEPPQFSREYWMHTRIWVDTAIVVIALVAAVAASLKLNYAGKPFGTVYDYLSIVFLGGGIDITLTGLGAYFSRFLNPK